MKAISPTLQLRSFSFGFLLLLGFVLLFGLVGCGGGSGSGNQNANGLFNGNADLDPTGSMLMINDLRGFVHNNRIIIFSIAEHILFDGAITDITLSDYTATVNLYEAGVMTQGNISVTGSVTSQSSISGSLNGTGVGSGNFGLTFDLLYNRGATPARISTTSTPSWAGPVKMVIDGLTTGNFSTINGDTGYDFSSSKVAPLIICGHEGTISIPDLAVNIYSLQPEVITDFGGCGVLVATDYSGFAAVVDDGGVDNTLLYAVTNSTHSVFAILSR